MKQRVVTGVLGGAGFLALLWAGGWWYTGLIAALATISYHEFCRMKRIRTFSLQGLAGLALIWLLLWSGLADQGLTGKGTFLGEPENILAGLVLFLLLTVISRNRIPLDDITYLFLGSLYIGYGFSYMIQARLIMDGFAWSLLIVVVTFASDSGAYFTGRKWGRRKLWPSISPNKTVEGSLGGVFLSVLASILVAWLHPELGEVLRTLAIGLLVSVVGQVGDLVESAMKRSTGTKDSGTLLPGHGGVLDRFDSLLLVFPVLHLFQLL
ncbi:phosphatidate cytidylyltransferase [Salinithrix halophila]|uniref:Phosphatidate cytidylyltransferase n=1 Tax=Salinithrix halophila TaxID=1485204 RepID=A0ABV8JKK9_9BACL